MNPGTWQQLELQRIGPKTLDYASLGDKIEAHRRRIAGYLTIRLPEPVDVYLTRNRTTMISCVRRQGRIVVRLHRLFRHAEEDVLEQLARYVFLGDPKSEAALDEFIEEHREEVARTRRRVRLAPKGRVHDLGLLLERVKKRFFEGSDDVRIGWGRSYRRPRTSRRAQSRALATYDYDTRIIRVNPVLDAPFVPEFIVEWVVYHEMIHHVLEPVSRASGRSEYHGARFRELERRYPRYLEARLWERLNLPMLLS